MLWAVNFRATQWSLKLEFSISDFILARRFHSWRVEIQYRFWEVEISGEIGWPSDRTVDVYSKSLVVCANMWLHSSAHGRK